MLWDGLPEDAKLEPVGDIQSFVELMREYLYMHTFVSSSFCGNLPFRVLQHFTFVTFCLCTILFIVTIQFLVFLSPS